MPCSEDRRRSARARHTHGIFPTRRRRRKPGSGSEMKSALDGTMPQRRDRRPYRRASLVIEAPPSSFCFRAVSAQSCFTPVNGVVKKDVNCRPIRTFYPGLFFR